MVGVPRSKGCKTCIQRRVKCDETRPSCANCARIKQVCPGYVQTVKFQDEGPRLRQKHEKMRDSESKDESRASPPSMSRTPSSEPRFEWDSGGFDSNTGPSSVVLGLVEGKTGLYRRIYPPCGSPGQDRASDNMTTDVLGYKTASTIGSVDAPFYSPSTYQLQILTGFAKSLPPSPTCEERDVGGKKAAKRRESELACSDLLLDTAVRAVTMVQFGRLENQKAFVDESRPHYGRALRLLHSAVLSKEEGLSSRTLCATVLLSYYEMFSSCDDATWVRHATGVGAIMRQRGPQRHRYGFDREIYLSYRHILLLEAFYQGKPSFLNEPQWRELSTQIFCDIQEGELLPSDRMEIYEATEAIYSHVTFLTQVCADAQQAAIKAKEMGSDLTSYILSMLEQLKDARIEMVRLHSCLISALQKLHHLPTTRITDDPVFPTKFTYENVYIAGFYSVYRTLSIMINAHTIRLGGLLVAHGLVDQETLHSYRIENRELATEICQSIDDMLRSTFLGPFHAVFALRIASQVFDSNEPQWDWVIAKLWEIGDRHMLMARHLPWYEDEIGIPQDFEHARAQMKQRQDVSRVC